MNILIYGFGNIAHAIIAQNTSKNITIKVFSPSNRINEDRTIKITNTNGLTGSATLIYDLEKHTPYADFIIFCIPSHARKKALIELSQYINKKTILGAIPGVSGFNEEVQNLCPECRDYFSLQRVPYIARIVKKGELVHSEPKDSIKITAMRDAKYISAILKEILPMDIIILSDFDSINLTNSNPLLHTARIYSHLYGKDYPFYIKENEMFYRDWTDDASSILIRMDKELGSLMHKLKLPFVNILQHYEVENASELTLKLQSISALKEIEFPMLESNGKYFADLNSRYFLEDFDFGLRYTLKKAADHQVEAETMQNVMSFYDAIKARALYQN